jgi:hypothetical protein
MISLVSSKTVNFLKLVATLLARQLTPYYSIIRRASTNQIQFWRVPRKPQIKSHDAHFTHTPRATIIRADKVLLLARLQVRFLAKQETDPFLTLEILWPVIHSSNPQDGQRDRLSGLAVTF